MALACTDVKTSKQTVKVLEKFTVTFKIKGAMPAPFTFPFSNESLTEAKIEFIREDMYGDTT